MTNTIAQMNKEKTMFWTLLGVLVISIGFYIFCINTTVRNIVMREQLENDSIKIALEISNKEFKYISLKNSLTIELAYAMGFKNVAEKTFIKANSSGIVSYAQKEL